MAKVVDLEALVSTVENAMRAHAALPAAELRLVRRHIATLRPRLEALGFEVTASNVRRPLVDQLLHHLDAGFVPAKGIEKRVRGANAKETKTALEGLVSDGRVRALVRASGPGFILASAPSDVIVQDDLPELLRRLASAQRLVKRAIAKKGSRARPAVLREEVIGPLLSFAAESSPSSMPSVGSRDDVSKIAESIRSRVDRSDRPLRIPDLLRSLGVDQETGKRALVEGASSELFGLEPESGMARLTPSDSEWCPSGPDGTRLSWVVARRQKAMATR